ncbi:cell division protein FtsL [Asticcacaulis tiandongensis]|uniref:cell division protein FtsL n=1 Tax=Asticcacaulis tiandongensis TaxID=2565365 RepID=UPI001127199C|nr:septum formation inhibitor MinC [Asticcacaulis tiandongensis]
MRGVSGLFNRRVRGIRLVELVGVVLAVGMMMWVGFSKVREGESVRRLNTLNAQIAVEEAAIKELQVRVAHLERPARIEALATQHLGMTPVKPEREARLENLPEISKALSAPDKAVKPVAPSQATAQASADPVATAPAPSLITITEANP